MRRPLTVLSVSSAERSLSDSEEEEDREEGEEGWFGREL